MLSLKKGVTLNFIDPTIQKSAQRLQITEETNSETSFDGIFLQIITANSTVADLYRSV